MSKPSFLVALCILAFSLSATGQESIRGVLADPNLNMKRPADRAEAVEKVKELEDKRLANARAKGRALGLTLREEIPGRGVRELVDFDEEGPVYRATRNTNAAISTGANLLRSSPYTLDGTGLIVGVWDAAGGRETHQEFATGSRLTNMDGTATHYHAMHVAGTVGALGVNPSARGMANAVKINSYNWANDTSEVIAAGATAPGQTATKVYLSNHSYGPVDGWGYNSSISKWQWYGTGTDQNAYDVSFGQYGGAASGTDSAAFSTPYLLSFWACGNDGTDGPNNGNSVVIGGQPVTYNSGTHPQGDGIYRGGYETISGDSIGKNIVAVGAVNDAVTSGTRDPAKATLASFSSTGPADDGRIKPDLVANGVGLTSTDIDSDTDYRGLNGTSMASPNACGSATLLVDQYNRLFGSAMRASTLKGLLIHTADDLGNAGPDYKFGWGLIDVKDAADLIIDHQASPSKKRITEDQVSTSVTTRTQSFKWDGSSPIRATLCWTDPAGSSTGTHDSRTPRLTNNLNLKLIAPNGAEYFPFVMPFVGTWTTASMALPATTGINNTDNVEQVLVASPGQAGDWQAVVTYSGALTNGLQDYSLLISGSSGLLPNTVEVTYPNGGEVIYLGSSETITWGATITGNVKIELFKGGSLHTVLSANEANDSSYTWSVSSGLPAGSDYTVKISSVDNPAYSDTSNAAFSILAEPTLADALDTTGLTWIDGGNASWFPQSAITHDGIDAAQSGSITDSQSSSMETTISEAGTLTFWWKVSSELSFDYLRFYINNVEQSGFLAKISGDVDWVQKTVVIPAGGRTVKWSYTKDGSVSSLLDTAWVDQVVFTPASAPEIAVEQPVGTDLADGSASIDFGAVNVGVSSPITFTVRNTGNTDLTGLAVNKTGAHGADYALGALGSTTVAPGGSTTFTVTFSPSLAGTRTAAIQIVSNDADENPFDINLTGTGIGPGTLAVNPAGGLTSSGNYGGSFSPSSLQYTLSNPGGTPINWTAGKAANWVSLSATGGTLAAGANTTVTVSINGNANTLNAAGYNDVVTFTNTTDGSGNTTRDVTLTVNPAPASLTLGNLNQAYDGSPKPVSVTTNPAGLAHTVTYGGSSTVPAGAGTYAVIATVTDANYTGGNTGSLVIAKASQMITFGSLPPVLDNAGSLALGATSSSGLTVSYSSSNTDVATVSGNTVTIVGLGDTTITASQVGDTNYDAAAPVPQTLSVVRSNPLAVTGGPYQVLIGQSLNLDGSGSFSSYGETITAYEWDLNNDNTFGDTTGATPTAIGFSTLTGTWGMVQGLNTIQLRITDSANKTSIVSTTVELVLALAWDANGTTAGQTNGAGAWLDVNKWWDGTANTNWVSGSNAVFGGAATNGGAVTLASPTAVSAITFDTFTGTYTLGTSGQAITLDEGIIMNAGSGNATIVSPVTLGGNQAWTNNSGGTLATGRNTNLIDNNGFQLTVDGTGTYNFGAISNTEVALTGSGALVKNGSGRLNIGGVNSGFSGTVTLNGGVTQVNNNSAPLGAGNVTLNGGVLSFYWGTTFSRTLGTGDNQVRILGGESGFAGSGTTGPTINLGSALIWGASGEGSATGYFNPSKFVLGDSGTTNAGATTFSNGIDLNGVTRTIVVPMGLSSGGNVSRISGAISSSGTAGLIKEGGGTLILEAANTYLGDTTISGGTLRIGNNTPGTLNSGNYSGTISMANNATLEIWSSTAQVLSGAISGEGGLNKAFGGALTLSGANTYTGRTSFLPQTTAGFTVNISSFNSVNGGTPAMASSSLGAPATIANGTIDVGSSGKRASVNVNYTGPGETTDRVINFGFNDTSSQTLTASGSGLLKFTSAMTSNSIGSQSGSLILAGSGSGEITEAIPDLPSGGLTKNGSGTWTLGGSSFYTGPTSISAGKLFIDGSLSNTAAALNVGTGATLGGTGTVGRNVTVAAGGKLEFDISTNAAGHDRLDISAGRDFVFAAASELTITSSSGAVPGIYTLVSGGNNITGVAPATVNLPVGWTANVSISGDSLILDVISTGNGAPNFAGYSIAVDEEGVAVVSIGKMLYGVTDPEGHSFSVSSAGPDSAEGGSVALGASSITYTAPLSFSGSDTFDVTVTDQFGASVTAPVAVTVRPASGDGGSYSRNPATVTMNGSNADIRFRGIPGRSYRIQRSTDLAAWADIGTVVAAVNGEIFHSDPNPPQGSAFYRLAR